MSRPYSIGHYRGELALIYRDTSGKRHRHALGTTDPVEADHRAAARYAEVTHPQRNTVGALWAAYRADHAGRRIVANMEFSWRALVTRFGGMPAEQVSVEDCRAHIAARRKAGIQDGTLNTELGHLSIVLNWGVKRHLIEHKFVVEKPGRPTPKTDHLTREQCSALIRAAHVPHIKTFIILALGTAGRNAALLSLTWDRVNFQTGLIDLVDPTTTAPTKRRAVVPMNQMVRTQLELAKKASLSDYVVEWAGERVTSVRRALTLAGNKAGVPSVSPHMLRHSAAVHMIEDGVDLLLVSQFLGHSSVKITADVYARYSPTFLKKAAAALEY